MYSRNCKYSEIFEEYRKSGNENEATWKMMERVSDPRLGEALNCLALGSGPGLSEITFIQKKMPRLEKLVCVEMEEDCIEGLKKNFNKLNKKITKEVYNENMVNWKMKRDSEKFDVVLCFQSLYGIEKKERMILFQNIFSLFLKKNGVFYVMLIRDVNEGEDHFLNHVARRLGCEPSLEIYFIKEDLKELNKIPSSEYKMEVSKINHSEKFVQFMQIYLKPHKKIEEIKNVLKKMLEEGHDCRCPNSLVAFNN